MELSRTRHGPVAEPLRHPPCGHAIGQEKATGQRRGNGRQDRGVGLGQKRTKPANFEESVLAGKTTAAAAGLGHLRW